MSQKATILIVEDNEMSLIMAQEILQIAGYQILEAENATKGIQIAKKYQPNLILMDMHMPFKSGYEAAQELKKDPDTADIPIVAFTALAMQEEQLKAFESGCIGVISKPIDIKTFAKNIEGFLPANRPS